MKKSNQYFRLSVTATVLFLIITAACKKPNETSALITADNKTLSKVTIQTSDSSEVYQQYSIQYDSTGRTREVKMFLTPAEKYPLGFRFSYKKDVITLDTFRTGDTTVYERFSVDDKGHSMYQTTYDADGYLTAYLENHLLTWKNGNLVEIRYLQSSTPKNVDTLHTYMEYYPDLFDRTRSLYFPHVSVRHIGMPGYWFSLEPIFGKSSKNLLKSIRSEEGNVDISYQLDNKGNPIKINYHIEDVEPISRPANITHTLKYEYR